MAWTPDGWKHHWSDSRELAVSRGRVAFRSGTRLSQNPYTEASDDAVNWECGWKSALVESQPQKKASARKAPVRKVREFKFKDVG